MSSQWGRFGMFLSGEVTNVPAARLFCHVIVYTTATAVVPVALLALVRYPGSRGEFALGCGLALLLGLLIAMLGMVCSAKIAARGRVPARSRWIESASGVVCFVLLVLGMRSLATLGLSPIGVTLGVLVVCCSSLAVLVLGMLSTLVQITRSPNLDRET